MQKILCIHQERFARDFRRDYGRGPVFLDTDVCLECIMVALRIETAQLQAREDGVSTTEIVPHEPEDRLGNTVSATGGGPACLPRS